MTLRRATAAGLWLVSLVLSADDWPIGTGGNSKRNGLTAEHGPTAPAILWDTCPHESLAGVPPVVGDGVVVTTRLDPLGDFVNGTWLVAQELDSGAELWSVKLPVGPQTTNWNRVVAIRNGHVYATRGNFPVPDFLYALDVADGSVVWHSEEPVGIESFETPLFDANGDLIVSNYTSIRRIDHTDGHTLWDTPRLCAGSGQCEVALYAGRLYGIEVTSFPATFVLSSRDVATGQFLHTTDQSVDLTFGAQANVFVGEEGTIYAPVVQDGTGWAFVALQDTGTSIVEKWRVQLPYSASSSYAVGPDGTVYMLSTDYELLRLDPVDGHALSTSLSFPELGPPIAQVRLAVDARGRVFLSNAAGFDGRLYAFDADLRLRWSDPVPGISLGGPAIGRDGTLVVAGSGQTVRAYRTPFSGDFPMRVDASVALEAASNANDVLEPGETVGIQTAWENGTNADAALAGTASNLAGPGGGAYTIDDNSADYGLVAAGATSNCGGATADCFVMTIGDPGSRPASHWDATFDETLSAGTSRSWKLHIGGSFADVPAMDLFYPYVETILHHEVTAGCSEADYCPDDGVTRSQMAVFLLKARHGPAFVPPPAAGTVFEDVPAGSFAADWIEELAREGITGGCSVTPALYCPEDIVTRAQMAVFLLKAEHGKRFVPPACAGMFPDVSCPGGFAVDWIERLAAEGVTAGCGGGAYCPDAPNTRGQMAPFLVKTFGLKLYGP